MTPDECEIKNLRLEVIRAETEVNECRKKVIREILDLFSIEGMAKKDLERAIRGML
jgi:hypothetical protein